MAHFFIATTSGKRPPMSSGMAIVRAFPAAVVPAAHGYSRDARASDFDSLAIGAMIELADGMGGRLHVTRAA